MNLNDRTRRLLIFSVLAATVLAVIFAPPGEETIQPTHTGGNLSAPSANIGKTAVVARQAEVIEGLMPRKRTGLEDAPGNLFLVDRPPPPPKPSGRPAPPPAPVAPPLPYAYMGKMDEHDKLTVFLTRGDVPYVARVGDILDGQYRVDAIGPATIEFTYIPLGQKQVLNSGASARTEPASQAVPAQINGLPPELQQKLKQMQDAAKDAE